MKKLVVIGVFMLVVGVLILVYAFNASGRDLQQGGLEASEKIEKSIENTDQTIFLDDRDTSVTIDRSDDDKIHFVYYENDRDNYDVDQNQDISFKKNRILPWFRLPWFDFKPSSFSILLPEKFQGKLEIKTTNGDIKIQNIRASELNLITSNGDYHLQDLEVPRITAITSNGQALMQRLAPLDHLEVITSNERVVLEQFKVTTLKAQTSNGAIELQKIDVAGDLELITSNDDITLKDLSIKGDARLQTSNSDIRGNILSKMSDFSIQSRSTNGSNNLPSDVNVGPQKLSVETSNGDIQIEFME